jgi:LPXTG-site transpeptidase (sortase) family protein
MNISMLMRLLLIAMVCLVLVPPAAPAQANTAAGQPIYFAETGHTLAYNFRQFYDRQGGLPIFGLPISEVFLDDGRPVQYFERARLEWHAPLARVQAGHLGRWAARSREHLPAFQPIAREQTPAGAMFAEATGHSLGGVFRTFWERNGGLATFGYPLSEEFVETNAQDGKPYTVQYFERARFEWHPEAPGGGQVQLGHLGRMYLAEHPAPEWAVQPVSGAHQAWDGIRPTNIAIPRIGVDVNIAMTGFSYGEWDVPRYTAAHYWPISAVPNTSGNIVIAGHVGYRDTIFWHLPNVRVGDDIVVQAGGGERRYVVDEVLTLLPSEVWVMNPTTSETLTLITCVPIGVYSHRLIVRASPAL